MGVDGDGAENGDGSGSVGHGNWEPWGSRAASIAEAKADFIPQAIG